MKPYGTAMGRSENESKEKDQVQIDRTGRHDGQRAKSFQKRLKLGGR